MSAANNQLIVLNKRITEKIQKDIENALESGQSRKYSHFILAALGSIPWVGGFLGTPDALLAENKQINVNDLHRLWLEEHQIKVKRLGETLSEILMRFEPIITQIQERIESPQYLALIGKGFRVWDQAETEEKRLLVKCLLSNTGMNKQYSYDVIQLFLDWIDVFHGTQHQIIKDVYKNPNVTLENIWKNIHKQQPYDVADETECFKIIFADLMAKGIIQRIPLTSFRRLIKLLTKTKFQTSNPNDRELAIDDIESYELTMLGLRFAQYTTDEAVPRVTHDKS